MLDPDLPLAELKAAYRNWRESKGANVDQVLQELLARPPRPEAH